jgi:hypothetical protein
MKIKHINLIQSKIKKIGAAIINLLKDYLHTHNCNLIHSTETKPFIVQHPYHPDLIFIKYKGRYYEFGQYRE